MRDPKNQPQIVSHYLDLILSLGVKYHANVADTKTYIFICS